MRQIDYHYGAGVTVLETIPGIGILRAAGNTVPTDGASGYAPGAFFHKLNGTVGTTLYVNEGTSSSVDFNIAVTPGAAVSFTGAIQFDSNSTQTDASTATRSGSQTFSGQVDHSGTVIEPEVIAPTAALSLTSAHYGKTIRMGSLCRKCTLPLAAASLGGVTFTFVNNHNATADATEQWIATVSGDKVNGGTTGIGIRGQSTADALGDHLKLICDGSDWWTISRSGTYAASSVA